MAADPSPFATRRQLAHARRRRRRSRVLGGFVAVVAVVVAALVFTDTLRMPSGAGPRVRTETAPMDDQAPGGSTPGAPQRRALTPDDPLRLWIGGDSLAGSLGPSLGEMTGATGVVQPRYLSRVSSGLLSEDFWDWPEKGAEEMATTNAEVVVFVIGTNDANIYDDSQAADYEARVDAMMTTLEGQDREVFWVGAPVMRDDDLDERINQVNAIAQTVAGRHPRVTYVDAYALFDEPPSEYASALVDVDTGEEVTVRASDGVHFTPEGGDLLAEAIFALLDPRWRLSEQTVVGQAKPVIVQKGTTQQPGTYRSGNSSSSGSSGSSSGRSTGSGSGSSRSETGGGSGSGAAPSTAPPATAPPATSPPATSPPPTSPPATSPPPTDPPSG